MSETSGSSNQQLARELSLRPKSGEAELTQRQIDFLARQAELQEIEKRKLRRELEHLEAQDDMLAMQSRALAAQEQQLRAHRAHLHIEHVRERLHIAIQITLCAAVSIVVILFGAMVWRAWHSQSVVVRTFSVPPEMEVHGLTGEVVAAGLIDELKTLQEATRSNVAKRSITDAWSGDVRLEIPETHVSLGDIERYLRLWLGHDVSIGGSVVQIETGIALTVRGTGFAGRSFTGPASAMPSLLKQAAEYVYGRSETVLFGYYLLSQRHNDEAIALARGAYASALDSDKPLLLNVWGNALNYAGRPQEALEKFRLAIDLQPDFWIAHNNVINVLIIIGQEEAAAEAGRSTERAARRGKWFAAKVPVNLWSTLDQLRWDLPATHRGDLEEVAGTAGGHGVSPDAEEAAADALVLAQMHDLRSALLSLQTTPDVASDAYLAAFGAFVQGVIELDRGAYARALAHFHDLEASGRLSDMLTSALAPSAPCYIAVAEEWAGDPVKADADIAAGGHLVDCYRFKGDIADHRGDWTRAQQEYARAVALAPSIPSSYQSWGDALLRHRDYAGAIAKFREANARSPHWADPIARWGDALAAQGNYRDAVERYSAAQRNAPNWGRLYLHWGQALERLDRHALAIERYRRALQLDLTGVERQSLDGCCSQ